jgi:uncharacterized protein YegP (UPF0339 family)
MKKIKLRLKEDLAGKWYWFLTSKNGRPIDGSTEAYSRKIKAIEAFNVATKMRFELFGITIPPLVVKSGYDFYRFISEDQIVITRPSEAAKKAYLQKKAAKKK